MLRGVIEGGIRVGDRMDTLKVKWNDISKTLFQVSGKKYLRTPKQCR